MRALRERTVDDVTRTFCPSCSAAPGGGVEPSVGAEARRGRFDCLNCGARFEVPKKGDVVLLEGPAATLGELWRRVLTREAIQRYLDTDLLVPGAWLCSLIDDATSTLLDLSVLQAESAREPEAHLFREVDDLRLFEGARALAVGAGVMVASSPRAQQGLGRYVGSDDEATIEVTVSRLLQEIFELDDGGRAYLADAWAAWRAKAAGNPGSLEFGQLVARRVFEASALDLDPDPVSCIQIEACVTDIAVHVLDTLDALDAAL